MSNVKRLTSRRLQGLKFALVAAALAGPAVAAEDDNAAANANVLRICAAADELPYSNRDGSGFENKIASALAETMGRKPLFVWFSRPGIYIVRDQLEMKMCDVVMGLDTGDPRVATTKPYYRAPYVFIQRKDTKLDIKDWNSPDLAKATKIGFTPGSPGQIMLEKIGLFREHFNYMHSLTNFQDKRNKFTRIPPQRMVNEVADATAEVAVNFAPDVARYAKASGSVTLTIIPDNNTRSDGEKVPHHFDQSIGVRKDDTALLSALDLALDKAKPKIEEILKDEGIPLVAGLPRS
ncbi:methanol oxidation system protein MoxJ [Hyphomicrobium sp.]|uniref:methanol oxidation system protein MoxJ n=1 Tax=Hyphomicrobium sp. TaxID=82 RepID=UPI002E31D468|nr:methanol oxidation system protein MoxJ [Hyphomicrobium sp.]HEX2842553.1 methanol oxidation system protein MoxJ [Hyphomicrobium sp.]